MTNKVDTKIKTKTEIFKDNLQRKVLEVTGNRISKQMAWDLFKAFIKTPYEQILTTYADAGKPTIKYGEKLEELSLSLSGIGSFRVIPVGGEDELSVKPRFYVSSAIENAIKVTLGFKADAVEHDTDSPASEIGVETGTPVADATPAAEKSDLDIDI